MSPPDDPSKRPARTRPARPPAGESVDRAPDSPPPALSQASGPRTREEALRGFRTDQILAAARQVIGEAGYADASIDRIAEAAGVARSTVYVYFEGKEDLLNQCLAQNRVGLSERVASAVDGQVGLEARLEAFLGAILAYVGEYQEFFRAIMRVSGLDPFFEAGPRPAPEIDAIRAESQAVMADILKDAERQAVLTPAGSQEARRLFASLIYGALMSRAHDPAPPPATEEAAMLVRGLLHGILRPR